MAGTVIVEIEGSAFPRVSIPKGTYVVWRNADGVRHSVETRPDASHYFNGGALHPGETTPPIYFAEPGSFPYLCRFHDGMEAKIEVTESSPVVVEPAHPHHHGPAGDPHSGHGGPDPLEHLHGFVTGGRSGRRLFLTHTPVIADDRHCYQVILQARLGSEAHVAAYDALRAKYGEGLVQTFHHHLSMPKIGSGEITEMPHARLEYYPHGPLARGVDVPGLKKDVPVEIERVIHCHRFEPDAEYPDSLEYLMYGDEHDVFIDHLIVGAPSFHSVAKLAHPPAFWDGGRGEPIRFSVPGKKIRKLEPRTLPRIAIVDNAFQVVWFPPPGLTSTPLDPLKRRGTGERSVHAVRTSDGRDGEIEIAEEGFLHMDIRLLNYGVLIAKPRREA